MRKILCIVLAVVLSSCSSILRKPEVFSVKKIAIVSIYANSDLHDMKAPKNPKTTLNVLKALMGKESDKSLEGSELVQIVTYGLKAYGEQLNSVQNWTVLPPLEVIKSEKYKKLMSQDDQSFMGEILKVFKNAEAEKWVTPVGMPRIPADNLTYGKGKKVVIKGRKDPVKDLIEKLAELCKELQVDAVAVIGLDLAYKKGMLSSMSGTGLLSGVRGKATPAVASEIIIVSKNAKIAVETKLISQGVEYSTSNSAPMMLKGKPDLKDSAGKSLEAYYKAVLKSAELIKGNIEKELNKK
ncbi:MAG: hypothetical protein ABII27_05105 [bacterium]